ncbi:zinc-binding dehydrogenase [Gordonia sp. TBRC 11910]|uniref:Zinc-binding dehydrogenase n=1 Tax=Gordonia asplenii TaxID=2725283 RepID=A0A848KZV4_9ACTN|nr:zinc-binding dehydrogenase [Gordonia asplenii]NMO03949.1 zinc-binding dehydrogenase [Gordonia asplenii]
MKAIVLDQFGDSEQLVLRDVDEPQSRTGWVTVELKASALNWHDVLVRQGRYGSPLPHTPGADGAGIRCDTGESVVILPSLHWGEREAAPGADFEILGDRTPGAYAEYVSVPVECLAPKPAGYSWAQAAALSLVGVTCFRALFSRARLREGESLLIVGAGGGVATMAASLAHAAGAHVSVTASTESKLLRAKDSGVDSGVLHTDDNWPQAARRLSPGGAGFDVVLDPVGLWGKSIGALRDGGRLPVLGANVAEQATLAVRPFFFGQFSVLGTTMGSPRDFAGLLDLVATGRVAPPPIAAEFPLADAARAHAELENGRHYGKLVLRQ